MADFSDRLKTLRKSRGLTQKSFAKVISTKDKKITASAVGMWEQGRRTPDIETFEAIADYFNVDMDFLKGKSNVTTRLVSFDTTKPFDNLFHIELKKFPLLGEIACGEPIFCNEERDSYVMAGANIAADFCLKAKGDSMVGARIEDGDVVFIREQPQVENGEIAAVIINDEATLKRMTYYPDQNLVILKAENSKYADIVLQGEQLNEVRVLGKAIAFQSDVR